MTICFAALSSRASHRRQVRRKLSMAEVQLNRLAIRHAFAPWAVHVRMLHQANQKALLLKLASTVSETAEKVQNGAENPNSSFCTRCSTHVEEAEQSLPLQLEFCTPDTKSGMKKYSHGSAPRSSPAALSGLRQTMTLKEKFNEANVSLIEVPEIALEFPDLHTRGMPN